MASDVPPEASEPSGSTPDDGRSPLLVAAGLLYLAVGLVIGAAWLIGEVRTSLLPTGWLLPAVLVITGALMAARRRFDIVATLWGALAFAVFVIDMEVYARTLDQGVENPGAFDATVIVGALAFVPLLLRPLFRR